MGQTFSDPSKSRETRRTNQLLAKDKWGAKSKKQILLMYSRYGSQFLSFRVGDSTPLERAVTAANPKALEFLLDKCPTDVRLPGEVGEDGECLLFMAGIMGNYEIISLLVEKYRSIHENFLHTLLWNRSRESDLMSDYNTLEQLCRGVYKFHDGETVQTILERTLQRYGYTEFTFFDGRSIMTYAAMFGQTKLVRVLIDRCLGNIHNLDKSGYSTIREACIAGHLDLVKMLVEEYHCGLNHLRERIQKGPRPYGQTRHQIPDGADEWSHARAYLYFKIKRDDLKEFLDDESVIQYLVRIDQPYLGDSSVVATECGEARFHSPSLHHVKVYKRQFLPLARLTYSVLDFSS